jgi:hypothetical protein
LGPSENRPNVPGCFSPKLVKLTAIARLNREYLRLGDGGGTIPLIAEGILKGDHARQLER